MNSDYKGAYGETRIRLTANERTVRMVRRRFQTADLVVPRFKTVLLPSLDRAVLIGPFEKRRGGPDQRSAPSVFDSGSDINAPGSFAIPKRDLENDDCDPTA